MPVAHRLGQAAVEMLGPIAIETARTSRLSVPMSSSVRPARPCRWSDSPVATRSNVILLCRPFITRYAAIRRMRHDRRWIARPTRRRRRGSRPGASCDLLERQGRRPFAAHDARGQRGRLPAAVVVVASEDQARAAVGPGPTETRRSGARARSAACAARKRRRRQVAGIWQITSGRRLASASAASDTSVLVLAATAIELEAGFRRLLLQPILV